MKHIKERLLEVQRRDLLAFLAQSVVEMTILARSNYGDKNATNELRRANESVHRIAGHIRALLDPSEPLSESRADGIIEALNLLPATRITHLLEGSYSALQATPLRPDA